MCLNIFRDSQCIKVFGSELVVNTKQTKQMKNGGRRGGGDRMQQKGNQSSPNGSHVNNCKTINPKWSAKSIQVNTDLHQVKS